MDSYLSGELTVDRNHDVLRHIEQCDSCSAELERRERMRLLLIESFGAAPETTAIQNRIASALDREQRRWRRWIRRGSVAAAVVLIAAGGSWLSQPVDASAFDDAVGEHIACALTRPPAMAYDANRAARSLDAPYLPLLDAVTHDADGYQLIDAHTCRYHGRRYAHLVYRSSVDTLSVFAEASTRGRLPLIHENPSAGFISGGASTGGYQVFVVSDSAAAPSVPARLIQSTLSFVKTLKR